MFQQYLTEHMASFSPFVAPTYVVNAAPHFRNCAAAGSMSQALNGRVAGTPVVNDYLSFGALCADPDRRGPMVLSYEFQFCSQNAGAFLILPLLIDRQGVTGLAANAITLYSALTDVAWRLPPLTPYHVVNNATTFGFKGAMRVDTSITSATPSITVREFGVGACIKLGAGGGEFAFSAQVRLHDDQPSFFQPGK